jgi:hypothetical protein
MREAVMRARWMALTLVTVSVGALSYQASPNPQGPDGQDALVLPEAIFASALPAPAWSVNSVPGVGEPRVDRAGRRIALRQAKLYLPVARLAETAAPDVPPRTSGGALLGLPATPANAPPRA